MKSCYDPRFILILGGLDVALMGNLGFFPLVFRYQLVVFCHWLIMEVVLLSLWYSCGCYSASSKHGTYGPWILDPDAVSCLTRGVE